MAFKIKQPFPIDNTPVYNVPLEDGVVGKADKNGAILVDKDVNSPIERKEVIKHEMVHIDQMKRGDLDYDDKNVYWKGKVYPRSKMNEGAKSLPWEKEAWGVYKK